MIDKSVRSFGRRGWLVAGATAAMVAMGGAAFAYFTASGSGQTTAQVSTGAGSIDVFGPEELALTIGQTVTISGTFGNENSYPVAVEQVDITVVRVHRNGATVPANECRSADFATTPAIPQTPFPVQAAGDGGFGEWTGGSVTLINDTSRNQNGCKGASVQIKLAAVLRTP